MRAMPRLGIVQPAASNLQSARDHAASSNTLSGTAFVSVPHRILTYKMRRVQPVQGRVNRASTKCLFPAVNSLPSTTTTRHWGVALHAHASSPSRASPPRAAPSVVDSLPLVYDAEVLEAYCAQRPREMNRRWAYFLRLTVPFVAKVGTAFSLGTLERDEAAVAREMCVVLSELGPTFVKLGQLVSSRADLIAPAVAAELSHLQNNVAPFNDKDAFKVIEQELGCSVDEVFSYLSPQATAAASLAQVYKGTLHSGESVAVKVQRPDALETVAQDLVILRRGVGYYQSTLALLFGELGRSTSDLDALLSSWSKGFYSELDFELEGRMQAEFRDAILEAVPNTYVPQVYQNYSTRRLLVTEWVDGTKLTDCSADEINYLTEIGADCFLFQLLELGKFHGDPHPGNMMMIRSHAGEKQLCLLDFGLVATIPDETRSTVACGIVYLADCNWPKLAENMVELDILPHDVDREQVHKLMDRILKPFVMGGGGLSKVAEKVDSRQLAVDLAEATADIPVSLPGYFALLTRAVSILEGVALKGDPQYSLVRAAAPVAARWLLRARSPAAQQAVDNLVATAGMAGLLALAGRATDNSDEGAVEMLVNGVENPAASKALPHLARWMLTENSLAAQTTLEGLLDASAREKLGPIPTHIHEDMPVGPLRLLALAKAATSLEKEIEELTGSASRGPFPTSTSSLNTEDPCPDVQRAMSFLLQSSTPQVQQQVVTQAVRASDLCSRFIVRGVNHPSFPGVGFVLSLVPGAIKSRSSMAWDSLFPPLTEFEESQAKQLVNVAMNTFGIRSMDELRTYINPSTLIQGVQSGVLPQSIHTHIDTVFGPQIHNEVTTEIASRFRDTYLTRLREVQLI